MKRWDVRRLLLLPAAALLLTGWCAAAMPETLVPVGSAVGIRLEADGLLVVGFDEEGTSPARADGLRKGDIIETVDGQPAESSQTLQAQVAASGGAPLDVTVERDGETRHLTLHPARTAGTYRLGVSVRDSMAGIGTVTYYNPADGSYGALGHGVNDLETLRLLPLEDGEILPASVVEVRRGQRGAPGLLKGAFNTSETLGTVEANTTHGIFGTSRTALGCGAAVPVADRGQVHTGTASILSNVRNTDVESYTVEILRLYPTEDASGRNLLLKITDERLLQATGGIVQGMSGSPILQDGKLIGAVTHVLVNDPTCGYGIFIDNMLETGEAAPAA